ncbi:hypothetical protein AVEN_263961-1 [Araneus ventricosus]|uniref:Uncharacterized protein n=1 Tax=Araneus ventricosus TaxID=182803 RepID=A0A4Y2HNC9_ARAVE|nr:hypothetical protein AVEN_263961-1 [Araneus ventricosus]
MEVESNDRLQLAQSGFAKDKEFQRFKLKEKTPTAVCIVSRERKRADKNDKQCLFCNKFRNMSECYADMLLEEKREVLKKKDAKVLLSLRNLSTLFLTVLVKIINFNRSGIVRGLFDTGAQWSFKRKDIADKLGLKPVDQEMLSQGLLGGSETKQEYHNIY